jgi:hypothetical protein
MQNLLMKKWHFENLRCEERKKAAYRYVINFCPLRRSVNEKSDDATTATRTKHRRSIKIRNSSEIDSHSGRRLLHVGLCIILYVTPTPKLLWSLCCPRALCCHATIAKRSQSRDRGWEPSWLSRPSGRDERAVAYCLLWEGIPYEPKQGRMPSCPCVLFLNLTSTELPMPWLAGRCKAKKVDGEEFWNGRRQTLIWS